MTDTIVKSQLETVKGLAGHVYPYGALKNDPAPFAFYRRLGLDELDDLDGGTGMMTVRYEIDCVARRHEAMSKLSEAVRASLLSLQSKTRQGLRLERVTCKQESPDLKEKEVNLYRRIYVLQINYQEV